MSWPLFGWDSQDYQALFAGIELVLVVLTLGFLYHEYRHGKTALWQVADQLWMTAFDQCEQGFTGIQQMMVDDDDILKDYAKLNGFPREGAVSDDEQERNKLFVFYETYYGHMARVFVITRRRGPDDGWKEKYWEVYNCYLDVLCRNPYFVGVHKAAKSHKSFEPDFIKLVAERIAQLKPSSTPKDVR